MRIWDVEPGCLCRAHLLGEHRELHGLWNILTQDKRGYRNHPETQRWVGKLAALYRRHEALVAEMQRRGYAHASSLDPALATGSAHQDVYIDSLARQKQILKQKGCPCMIPEATLATGPRLRLRGTLPDDIDYVMQLESDPENTPYIAHWPHERHLQALGDASEAHWIIESTEDDARIGFVIMQDVGAVKGARLRRIAIARKGTGLGREAIDLVKEAAFETLGAQRLWLDVQPHNARAMHVYESCGFTRSGELLQHIRGNDVTCIVMETFPPGS